MKKTVALMMAAIMLMAFAGCTGGADKPGTQDLISTLPAEGGKPVVTDTPAPTEAPVATEEPTLKVTAEELAAKFTLDNSSGFAKELEDAWKADKSNEEIAAMHYYATAKFYEDINDSSKAWDAMENISPDYDGVMSDEIIAYGMEVFGDAEVWRIAFEAKNERRSKINDEKRSEIKKWINDRYSYYDKKEGKYSGDKYTKTIFKEAAELFELSYAEIYNIWCDLPF